MATIFDRWKKDPFFSAAEEVQESADRMESAYRHWLHEMKLTRSSSGTADSGCEVSRELHTALGTAKWQLEELERAVRSNDEACAAGEDTRARHNQFVEAITNKISTVEDSLKCSNSNLQKENSKLTWVSLDQCERDELALFLSYPSPKKDIVKIKPPIIPCVGIIEVSGVGSNKIVENGDNSKQPIIPSVGIVECGHRRTASASPDLETWKILVSVEEGEQLSCRPPQKVSSYSCLPRDVESSSKEVAWPKNGFRKWKFGDQQQSEELIPLRNHQLAQGINAWYERSESCLTDCGDESYNKELYGWVGALHRQLQRSQYHFQYGRPVQMVFWAVVLGLLIVLFITSVI